MTRALLVLLLITLSGDAAARGGDVKLPEGASAEKLVLGLARANRNRAECLWREKGPGSRVLVGDAWLPGRLECDPAVVQPWLAGRTRAARTWLRAPGSGTTVAVDRYGEIGEFFGVVRARTIDLGATVDTFWDLARAPLAVVVLPGGAPPPLELPPEPGCAIVEPFTVPELVQALQGAHARMDFCWPRNAPPSAFTFDIVSDAEGGIVPTPFAALRKEPKVAACLARALAAVRLDPERSRCHQVRVQWPVTSGR